MWRHGDQAFALQLWPAVLPDGECELKTAPPGKMVLNFLSIPNLSIFKRYLKVIQISG
jgi:hypothetical protein